MADDRSLYRELTAVRVAATPYRYPARRDSDLAAHVDLSITRAWALVNAAIDKPDVVAVLPGECSRLRRVREQRRAARAVR